MVAALEPIRGMRVWHVVVLLLVVLGSAGGTYGAYRFVTAPDQPETDTETQLIPVQRGDLISAVSINGSLVYADRETLRFGSQGTLDELLVEEGQRVQEGEVLARLDVETVANLEKVVAQRRVDVRNAEEALVETRSPYTDLDFAKADADVADARLALETARDALADLLSPAQLQLAQAEAALANAEAALGAAEDAVADLTSPPALRVAQAEAAVANAEAALGAAEDAVTELTSPSALRVAQAEANVANAKVALKNADEAVEALVRPNALRVAQADAAVASAEAALRDAEDRLQGLSIANALSLVQAESAVVDAEATLKDAQDALSEILEPDAQATARAEANVASAELAVQRAQEAVDEARSGPDDTDVAKAQSQIDLAVISVANAKRDEELAVKEWDDRLETASEAFDTSLDDYRAVFQKWLGIELAGPEEQLDPASLLSNWGADLEALYDPRQRFQELGGLLWAESSPPNDPDTRWDEVVVHTWVTLFPGSIVASCEDRPAPRQGACVAREFDDAWDAYGLATDQLDTLRTQAAKALDSSGVAVTKADESLASAQESLADLTAGADPLDVQGLENQLAIARTSLAEAGTSLAELLAPEALQVETREAQIAVAKALLEQARADLAGISAEGSDLELAVLQRQRDLAAAQLDDAREALAVLTDEAQIDETEMAVRQDQRDLAAAQLDDAKESMASLTDMSELDQLELSVRQNQRDLARAQLDDAREALAALNDEAQLDQLELTVRQKQRDLASAQLVDAREAWVALLDEADPLEVSARETQVELARASLAEAEEDRADLSAVDPLDIALREADLQAARTALDSALATLEGAILVAPWTGIVAAADVEVGQQVNPNTAILEMVDPTVVEVDGIVDEIDVLFLQVGARSLVTLEALGDEALEGTVSEIAATARSQQGVVSYPIRIRVDTPSDMDLPEGLSAVAQIILREERGGLLVPIQALHGTFQEPTLLVQVNGRFEERPVTLGISDDFWTVVAGGVAEGESVAMEVRGAGTAQFGGFQSLRRVAGGFGGQRGGRPPGGAGGGGGGGGR